MRHHFLSKFYLRGFTREDRLDGTLWVFEKKQVRQWQSTPANAAHRRDYYRTNFKDGSDPHELEKEIARLEGEAAPAIRRLIEAREVPDGEDFNSIMNFIALMVARVPGARAATSDPVKAFMKQQFALIVDSPENWKATLDRMKRDGHDVGEKCSYEEMREFVQNDDYDIKADQNWEIGMMLLKMDFVLQPLAHLGWSVLFAQDDSVDFICSDHPVVCTWLKTPPGPYSWSAPAIGMPDSVVTFPVNRKVALIGEIGPQETVSEVGHEWVARINSLTAKSASTYLYSPCSDFCWLRNDGKVCGRDDLMEAIRNDKKG